MAIKKTSNIRNIGIIAHIDAGKTTLSERILFYAQKIHKLGEVHDGAATMDYLPEEQERGITITSACSTCNWQNCDINLIDTPGHVDFTIEVERSLRVLDGAVGVFCAVGGVEPQSETVWRQSEKFGIPKLAFINKIDREGADFFAVLDAMRARLNANPVPINIPSGSGSDLNGIIDLIKMEKLRFSTEDQGRTVIPEPLSDAERQLASEWREKMIEAIAETDDAFMEKWLENNIENEDIIAALRKATIANAITPVLAGAALRNCGVQPLMDAIVSFLPSPADLPPIQAELANGKSIEITPDKNSEPVALVFKVIMEGNRKNSFIRLYSGIIREGQNLYNSRTQKMDRAGRLMRLHADRRENIDELGPGDIAAIVGLRDAKTGDTYAAKDAPVMLEPIGAHVPVITLALEPLNAEEGKILDEALSRYAVEDPTLMVKMDEDSGMRELSGMGELHLDVTLERLAREYNIRPRSGQPKAIMRETVTQEGAAKAVIDRELGKERHYGNVEVSVKPRNRGEGIIISDYLPENEQEARRMCPPVFRQAVREGIANALATGVVSGWPVTDIEVHINAIDNQEGVTTVPGLQIAAGQALREAMLKAVPATLEPVMNVELTTPEDYLGAVINLFNQSGGQIENIEDKSGVKVITGRAPLRQLFGFLTPLRSASQGRAGMMLTFRNFDLISA